MKQKESAGLVIIYNGMVLLAHTTGRKWWGSYGIPKGGIEPGESRMDAAIRETREEVGLDIPRSMIDPSPRTYVLTSRKYKYTKTVYWYTVRVDDLGQIGMKGLVVPKSQLQLEEVDWAGFMPLAEAKKRAMGSQQQLLTQLVGLGLLESRHSVNMIYKQEHQKTPNTMKYVKLFEQSINKDLALTEGANVKKGDIYINATGDVILNGKRGMVTAKEGDTLKLTKQRNNKTFNAVLTYNSGSWKGDVEQVLVDVKELEGWNLQESALTEAKSMKHVKLFEQFINEEGVWTKVPESKPKRHKIYKEGDVLIKTDNELQGMRIIDKDKDRGAKKSTIIKMTDAQKGDTFEITKVEKMKYFHGNEYTGVLTVNSGPSAGETLDVMTTSDKFENWKLKR